MSALPNVLTTQSAPRPSSPVAAGLAVASDRTPNGQGQDSAQNQSFAETVLHQSNNQTALDAPPTASQRQAHTATHEETQTLSLSNIGFEDSDIELSANELSVEGSPSSLDNLGFGTDTAVDSKVKIDGPVIAEIQTPNMAPPPADSDTLTPQVEGSGLEPHRTLSTHQTALATPETQTTARTELLNSSPQDPDLNQQIDLPDRTELQSRFDLQTTVATVHPQAGASPPQTPLSRTERVGDQRILSGNQAVTPDNRVLEVTSVERATSVAMPANSEDSVPVLVASNIVQQSTPSFEPATIITPFAPANISTDITTPQPQTAIASNIAPANTALETIQTRAAFVDNAAPQTSAAQVTDGQTAHTSPDAPAPQTLTQPANLPSTSPTTTEVTTIPAPLATAPTTPSQADAQNPKDGKNDRPLLSERAAETADYRAAAKTAAPAPDLTKIIDAPSSPTTLFASNDGPTLLKSTPVFTVTPTLTPISGMSDRLAASILQTTNAQPAVTMDKLPQAVVAIALSAKSATLQIDPPELGRIQLDYQFDTQGRTVVTLTPESDAARAALMDRMAVITAALEQGSNSPIDVKLGNARDFGSEFGQASQDGDNSGSESGSNDGSNGSASNTIQNTDHQRFTRAPAGEPDRLHILV